MFKEFFRKIFCRRGKYSSPYYGNNTALFGNGADIPQRPDTEVRDEGNGLKTVTSGGIQYTVVKITDAEWERRRFELMKMLVCQERRSVVLGKLTANNRQIAENARKLTDAALAELVNHPYRTDYDTGKPKDV